jgi:hypothetical protein
LVRRPSRGLGAIQPLRKGEESLRAEHRRADGRLAFQHATIFASRNWYAELLRCGKKVKLRLFHAVFAGSRAWTGFDEAGSRISVAHSSRGRCP